MIYQFTIIDNLKNKNYTESFTIENFDKSASKNIAKKMSKSGHKINFINIFTITFRDIIDTIEFGKLSESPNCGNSFFDFSRYDLVCKKY